MPFTFIIEFRKDKDGRTPPMFVSNEQFETMSAADFEWRQIYRKFKEEDGREMSVAHTFATELMKKILSEIATEKAQTKLEVWC